jgi:hypothetical protein
MRPAGPLHNLKLASIKIKHKTNKNKKDQKKTNNTRQWGTQKTSSIHAFN